jgi:hypothetical protein
MSKSDRFVPLAFKIMTVQLAAKYPDFTKKSSYKLQTPVRLKM